MSGKLDKSDAENYGSNSKVLKKARSFRDDLKHRIIRRNPATPKEKSSLGDSVQGERLSSGSSASSPKLASKAKLGRGSSFKEEAKTEKHQKTDVEKLKSEGKKVHHALLGLKVVVEKDMLHMLPGSATVVLETVMEVLQLLGNFFVENDSSVLLSAYKQVNQSVANLMKWSDEILLQESKAVDKEVAAKLIKSIEDGMKDLMKLSMEKLETKSSQKSGVTAAARANSPGATVPNGNVRSEGKQRSSLPDIVLTPQEEKGLNLLSKAVTEPNDQPPTQVKVVSGDSRGGPAENVSDRPPPKPPLPANFSPALMFNRTPTSDNAAAPPLPPKKRTGSASSLYDNYDASTPSSNAVASLWSQVGDLGNASHGDSSTSSEMSYNPADLLRASGNSGNSSFSDNSSGVFSDISSSSDNNDTTLVDFVPGELFSQKPRALSDDLTLKADSRPESVSSQLSKPSMDGSAPEILDSLNGLSMNEKSNVRRSHYDNFTSNTSQTGKSSQFEIQNLTQQIQELTVSVETDSFTLDKRPPLPMKKNSAPPAAMSALTQRATREHFMMSRATNANVLSQYDNFQHHMMAAGRIPFPMSDAMHTSPELQRTKNSREIHAGMTTSHSAFEFSSSSSSTSSSTSSSGFHRQINANHATFAATKSEQVMMRHGVMNGGHQVSTKQIVSSSHEAMSAKAATMIGGLGEREKGGLLQPPPLPPKKKNVEAYMQIVGQYTKPNVSDLSRHSVNAVSFYQTMWHQHQLEMFHQVNFSRSNTLSIMSELSASSSGGRNSDVFSIHSGSSDDTAPPTPPFPPRLALNCDKQNELSLPDIHARAKPMAVVIQPPRGDSPPPTQSSGEGKPVQVIVQNGEAESEDTGHLSSVSSESSDTKFKDRESVVSDVSSVLEEVDVTATLIRQKQGDEEPDIRGGSMDALIVHATAAGRKEILYQEAFLTTYRTFIKSKELIERLLHRYNFFCRMDTKKKKIARNTFSLLVRVVDELCTEIDTEILQVIVDIVHQLVSQGELMLAKILRRKVLEKVEQKKQMQLDNTHHVTLWESHHMTTKQYSLLEFKPETLAEQMTLLDAELFQKIEIPEVLLWAKDQNEEQSPNLTKFTEHFNKMSYWCRTQILQQEDAKEREKYLVKFIKIMKFLRKYNNFNSYLAILSAVDSAPVRRLEWQKQNVEVLKELSHLIDSSSSFRAYRQALAETEPPCIPYIGIILQDLTFVHIGNPDYLSEGCLNFSKRWQQFGILDNMKRFKAAEYTFKKHHKIIAFFNGFDENLSEESLWQISEVLKPRGGKKKPPET